VRADQAPADDGGHDGLGVPRRGDGSKDGSVRVYDCRVCGDLASLEALAEAWLARSGLGR